MPQPDWEELDRRISRIEHVLGLGTALPEPAPTTAAAPLNVAASASGLIPSLGRALLGLAGAYLLRALTESATIAPRAGAAAGILYAVAWLAWAARPGIQPLEAALRALTSVLVICPLVWESVLYLNVISTWTAGSLLALFAVFGILVSWRRNQRAVSTIVTLAGLAVSAGLLVATRDVVPFTLFFLIVAAAAELSSCLEHRLSERWLAAAAADLAVLLATWLLTREGGLPEGYAAIPFGWLLGAQVSLLAIYLASTIVRTLLHHHTFTYAETGQCAAAFLIGVGGGLRLSKEADGVAVFALVCAAACYLVSFLVLDRQGMHGRNFYIYSTFGILLMLAGTRILLAGVPAAATWPALALGCIWAGGYFGRLTLEVHGGVYLLLALAGTGALRQASGFILGAAHWDGAVQLTFWAGLAAAALCYLLTLRHREGADSMVRLAVAGAFVWLLAGGCAVTLVAGYHVVMGALATHPYCATLRTGALAGIALLLAWCGARWDRVELSRLVYAAMLLGAYRLVTVDMGQGNKAALFVSLLLYGGALMALPKVSRAAA